MADPRTLPLDGHTRPWGSVPDLGRCPACFGALPPDTEAACSECGTGTPPGLTVLQPPAPPPAERGFASWASWPNPPAPDRPAIHTWGIEPPEPVTELPPDTPSTTDHIGDEECARRQIEAMRAVLEPAHVHVDARRRPWWMVWRRR